MLLYCDNYWPMDFNKMFTLFKSSKVDALVTVYNNTDNYTKNNLRLDENGFIEIYDKTREAENLQGVDIGFYILKKTVLNLIPDGNHNFEKTILPQLIKNKKIIAYASDHRYYSVGSHKRLALTNLFLEKRKTVILDRDGVINKKAKKSNYIKNWNEWEWISGSKEAIGLLKNNDYQIIIASNQAGISRGEMSENDLEEIHRNMKNELVKFEGSIDAIYYCPHGWDENCECRKPKPGMLFQAQRDFHLDLSETYFVGDDIRDIEAGTAAGMKTFLVSDDFNLLSFVKENLIEKV